ncbi:hypothetical protein C8F01DRAFT_1235554 [Mycena amicta]|nr:hypothetical protein C8F01DRAFT_1235554 [Mycena amicta]
MAPAAKQRRGWPPPVLAFLSAKVAIAVPLDQPEPLVHAVANHATPTRSRRHVPPQYSPGADGLWRRIDSYTLVGSTICDSCTITPTSVQETDSDFLESIPQGWVHPTISTPTRTSITVGLSVSLAVFIVLTLIRCHFSLRASSRRRKDAEKQRTTKRERVESIHASTETLALKASAVPKSRKWMTRATARWRENARYLARQRRGRRHSRRGSTDSLVEAKEPDVVDSPTPPPSSRPPSPSPSTSRTPTAEEPEPSPLASEPPAYLSPPLKSAPTMDLRDLLSSDSPSAEVFPPYTPRPAPDESSSSSGYFDSHSTSRATASSAHTAHLATDDKALLARLADRASAPEMRLSAAAAAADRSRSAPTRVMSTDVEARAPAEDDLEYDFDGFEWTSRDRDNNNVDPPEDDVKASRPPPPPRLPSPPPISASGHHTTGAAVLEKMQLERAYAARDHRHASANGPSVPSLPSAPPAFLEEEGPVEPSAPAFDDFYLDGYPEEGPSTPREAMPSAPPVEEDDELEYEDVEEDEDELRRDRDRWEEEMASRSRSRSAAAGPESGGGGGAKTDSDRANGGGGRTVPSEDRYQQVHDTGWEDG